MMQPSHLCSACLLLVLTLLPVPGWGSVDLWRFDNQTQEKRYLALIEEVRCPKCDGQAIAGSNAPIARDLRETVYQQVTAGRSDRDIRLFLELRYGESILYRPKLSGKTMWLWLGPLLFLLVGVITLIAVVWRSASCQNRHAEPDSAHKQTDTALSPTAQGNQSGEGGR